MEISLRLLTWADSVHIGAPFNVDMPYWELAIFAAILLIILLIPLLMAAQALVHRKPDARNHHMQPKIEVFQLPGWQLRRVSADAMIVISDETGWLGHGISKYVKDKGDYGLDDRIKASAPIPPGSAKAFAVKRLPVRQLIVVNIYDERKLTSTRQFEEAFLAAVRLAAAEGAQSVVVFDPAEQWNYFTERTDVHQTSDLLLSAIRKCKNKVSMVRIVVTSKANFEVYKEAIRKPPARSAA